MGFLNIASTAFAIVPLVTAQIGLDLSSKPKCVDGLQVITASGTFQSGYSTLAGLTDSVKAIVPDSASVALEYPHNESPYVGSVAAGVNNMTAYIQHYVDNCPDVKLAILGYSQGAQVTLSSICGWPAGLVQTYNQAFDKVQPMAQKYRENIVAIVTYGDPTHSLPNSFDRGTSTHDGEFARPLQSLGTCDFVSDKIAAWCDHGDEFCDDCPPPANKNSPNPRGCDINVHHTYWLNYNTDAVNFVRQRYQKLFPNAQTAPSTTSGSGGSPSDTSTPAASQSSSGSGTSAKNTGSKTSTSLATIVALLFLLGISLESM